MSLICDKCHEQAATIVLTQIIGNKQIKLYLCEKCANETEGLSINNNSLQKFLGDVVELENGSIKNSFLQCEKCGMTLNEFRKTSKIGCSNCYKTFGNYLGSIFKRMHGNVKHTGKHPEKLSGELQVINKIKQMQRDLQTAISNEEFEEAARLRDEIRALKSGAGI